jgi:uncharacterized protein YdcH (DUF465 family)
MIDYEQIKPDLNWPDKDYYPFYYKNLRAEQHKNIFRALDILSDYENPSQIIEIGASNGGFTKILDDHPISKNAKIYSFELNDFNPNATYSEKVHRIKGNCFHLEETISEIIKRNGTTLVFCDGGDKNLEINVFSKHLKIGDLIFGHDYAPTREYWENNFKGKIWDWHETWDSEIQEACKNYNLLPFLETEFLMAVWKSLKKY